MKKNRRYFSDVEFSVYLVIGVARNEREAERERGESESEWVSERNREREIMKLKQNDKVKIER